jgi:Protein of unknown function (DUF2796)
MKSGLGSCATLKLYNIRVTPSPANDKEATMRKTAIVAAVGAIAAFPVTAEERRELGAHEHGHSVLNIAIEGDRIEMELMSPGMDIVGFEHAPKPTNTKPRPKRLKPS